MPPIKELARLTREGNFGLVKSKLDELMTSRKYTAEEIVNQLEDGNTLLTTAALHGRLDILEYFLLLTDNEPPFIFRSSGDDRNFLSILDTNGEINKLSADSVAVIKKTFPDFDAAKPASWQSILSIRAELLGPLVERVGAFNFTRLYLAHIGYEPKGPEWQSSAQPSVINKPLD